MIGRMLYLINNVPRYWLSGLRYVRTDEDGAVRLKGTIRDRSIRIKEEVVRRNSVSTPRRYKYTLRLYPVHGEPEFEHRLEREFDVSLSVHEFTRLLLNNAPTLGKLVVRHSEVMDSWLDLRGYHVLSLENQTLTYQLYSDRYPLWAGRIWALLKHLSDFADALEAAR